MAGTQTSGEKRLIRGICFSNGIPLIVVIDTGATHSFIFSNCVRKLDLVMSNLSREMVIETPSQGSVTTSFIYLRCSLLIFDKDFVMDLICLHLSGLEVILGMDWLEYNHAHINCYGKSILFLSPDEEGEADFLSAKQLCKLM